jgi:hypothetical protein
MEESSVDDLKGKLNQVSQTLQLIQKESKEKETRIRTAQLNLWVSLRRLHANRKKLKQFNIQRGRIETEYNELVRLLQQKEDGAAETSPENGQLADLDSR